MKHAWVPGGYAAFVGAWLLLVCGGATALLRGVFPDNVPTENTVFTSTRTITCLAALPDGTVWAGTTGGVLLMKPAGTWQKFTRTDGLPAHEVRGFVQTTGDNDATVLFADKQAAQWNGTAWHVVPPPTEPRAVWQQKSVVLTPGGELRVGEKVVPLPPPTTGTHFSAFAPDGDNLLAAVWGDATLYRWNNAVWTPAQTVALPNHAGTQITALAANAQTLWVGTRRDGLWCKDGGGVAAWQTIPVSQTGPTNHNAQAMTLFRGELWVSTLEDGLVVRGATGEWRHIGAGEISTNAPRQLLVFQNALYVRNGNGAVDKWDGATWAKNSWAGELPRKQVSAFATNGSTLYAAQWGGWSAWNGTAWTHFLREPALQGVPVTALLPDRDGKTLWIGTQSRGIAESDRTTGTIRHWHNEQTGLQDEWITTLHQAGDGRVVAGTFVGGLSVLPHGLGDAPPRWQSVPSVDGENITALADAEKGGLYVATRHGVYGESGGKTNRLPLVGGKETEAQCLCAASGGVWVGTRTGIYWVCSPRK